MDSKTEQYVEWEKGRHMGLPGMQIVVFEARIGREKGYHIEIANNEDTFQLRINYNPDFIDLIREATKQAPNVRTSLSSRGNPVVSLRAFTEQKDQVESLKNVIILLHEKCFINKSIKNEMLTLYGIGLDCQENLKGSKEGYKGFFEKPETDRKTRQYVEWEKGRHMGLPWMQIVVFEARIGREKGYHIEIANNEDTFQLRINYNPDFTDSIREATKQGPNVGTSLSSRGNPVVSLLAFTEQKDQVESLKNVIILLHEKCFINESIKNEMLTLYGIGLDRQENVPGL